MQGNNSKRAPNFNSHTPHGVRHVFAFICRNDPNFNSHTPHGVRLHSFLYFFRLLYFNSHTPHGVRHGQIPHCIPFRHFNSHTPHGVRQRSSTFSPKLCAISTHTPHTGCDLPPSAAVSRLSVFQLTHPTRGATFSADVSTLAPLDFNSHTPHGVRRNAVKITGKP